MKKVIFIGIAFLSVFLAKGQQQLSYSYDAAGNRTNRTIVVGTQRLSNDELNDTPRFYTDSLDGKKLAIRTEKKGSLLHISMKGIEPSSKSEYALLNSEGMLIIRQKLSATTTPVKLEDMPSGDYTLLIHVNHHSSTWNLIKL